MPSKEIIPLIQDSYLAVIKNSLGSIFFRHFYVKVGGKKEDVLKNGKYACAFYVTNILLMFGLIKKGHCTVSSAIKDMERSGWHKIKKPRVGCVILWQMFDMGDNDLHQHLGFYIGNNFAISNSSKVGQPVKIKYNYRPIENFYWHRKLERK